MSWRRDFSRPVKWTKDGKLVYADIQEKDTILWNIKLTMKRLINHIGIDGFTNRQLAQTCKAWALRSEENELSN